MANGRPLLLLCGGAHPALSAAVAAALGTTLAERIVSRFPDGEIRIEVDTSVRDRDVFILQPTAPQSEEQLLRLLLLADAAKRAGAERLTAVIPYFAYARQDRRASGRSPVAARLVGDLLHTAGFDRLIAIDLHSKAMEGVFSTPLEHLSAIPTLVASLRASLPDDAVIVAPDLGGAKLAERWATLLNRPTAIVHKERISGSEVRVRSITGDVEGRHPVLVDDMISTGGTMEAALGILAANRARMPATIVATHGLLVGNAVKRLRAAGANRIVTTDTVATLDDSMANDAERISIAPVLADAIGRINAGASLSGLVDRA